MNNVLSEAQTLQDELSSSVRSNINKIEEYKRLIRELEKSTQSFKNQSEELQDLISLFVVSDK
ncbi:MAG: DUF1552 domain-containing protein [Ignavibacteriales bacterium]|nr:DUF1552 domain-containing protein [Ignavibacteriales bacterium]